MGMSAPVDIIGTHVATGASAILHKLGKEGVPGTQAKGIESPIRHVHITGTFVGTVKLEGSLDGTNFTDWITSITAPAWYIIPDGPLYIRSNCTAFTSGSIVVKAQKFVED